MGNLVGNLVLLPFMMLKPVFSMRMGLENPSAVDFFMMMKKVLPLGYYTLIVYGLFLIGTTIGTAINDDGWTAVYYFIVFSIGGGMLMYPFKLRLQRKLYVMGVISKPIKGRLDEKFREVCNSLGFVQKLVDGGRIYPQAGKMYNGDVELVLPNSVHVEGAAKDDFLAAMSQIFVTSFETIETEGKTSNVVLLKPSRLPEMVHYYGTRPERIYNGFYIGKDANDDDVFMNFAGTPVALITGGSNSGKSTLARVVLTEAMRKGYDCRVVDGKGGLDWADISPVLHTEFAEVEKAYKELVELMQVRLQMLRDAGVKNWLEYCELNDGGMQPVLMFMDEASDFFSPGSQKTDPHYNEKWEIIKAASELARKSRAAGIFQLISLQAAKADSLPDDIRNNAIIRVSYSLPSAAMSQTLFESSIAFDPTLIRGKGVYKGADGRQPFVFRSAILD